MSMRSVTRLPSKNDFRAASFWAAAGAASASTTVNAATADRTFDARTGWHIRAPLQISPDVSDDEGRQANSAGDNRR